MEPSYVSLLRVNLKKIIRTLFPIFHNLYKVFINQISIRYTLECGKIKITEVQIKKVICVDFSLFFKWPGFLSHSICCKIFPPLNHLFNFSKIPLRSQKKMDSTHTT